MKNRDVISAWWWGRPAKSGNLKTDGDSLWSYNLKIGEVVASERIVYNYRSSGEFISVTTSKHVGLAARLGKVVEPR